MPARSTLLWIALLGLAAPPAWGLGVAAETKASGACFDIQENAPALCANADQFGSAAAAADDAFNGGIQFEFAGDNQTEYFAGMGFQGTYQNISPFPQPLQILSILLPGRVQLVGEATVRFFLGMEYAPLGNPGSGAFQVHASEMRLDVGALDPVWENFDLTGVPRDDSNDPPFQNAGVPSNWPQSGPVGTDVTLPFSVLGFDFGMVAPGEQFQLDYSLNMTGTVQGFVEFVAANVGDPLQLEDMPFYQIDESVFAEVPEPGAAQLLALGLVGLAARRRLRGGR